MKNSLYLIVFIYILISCSPNDPGYNIQGILVGLDSVEVKLLEIKEGKSDLIGSAKSLNGKFQFTGKVLFPTQYFIDVEGVDEKVKIFIENSDIEIRIDPKNPSHPEIVGSE